ncbi:uncharacterized protein LOC143449334 [Clavelina lepadiformis]|uniref:uncharacterized protein LOC143449334 n=1 Tax=Clavelina lepadiformis TaxID=159417 RepID=UPI004041E829
MHCGIILLLCVNLVYGDFSNYMRHVTEDKATNVKFPNDPHHIIDINEIVPIGHLQQFGNQRRPIGQVPEYFVSPSPRELWNLHVKPYRPAILRGMLGGSPALSAWNDDYLADEYGTQEVLVEKKLEDRKTEPKRMLIEAFLQQYEKQNWYVVSVLPDVMKKDIKVPKPLMCSTFRANLQELNLWIGTHGTRSMLHYDADNIMHCLVAGRKDWILIHPMYKNKIDMNPGSPGQQSGYSLFDVDKLNVYNNPDVDQVSWEYASLFPGDCLYVPPQYLHQVRSYNRSISVTFLFYPGTEFSDEDCNDVDLDSYLSLKNVFVYWGYEKGQETVDMGYGNPSRVQADMTALFHALHINSFTWHEYIYIHSLFFGEDDLVTASRFVFNTLDVNGDNVVRLAEMEKVNVEKWKEICRNTESLHGPTRRDMLSDPHLSNISLTFNPRSHQHYDEARLALKFLNQLVQAHGQKNFLAYTQFKKHVQLKYGDPQDAFLLVDANMDGFIHSSDLEQVPMQFLKSFYNMINFSNKRIHADFIDEEQVEKNLFKNFLARCVKTLENMTEDTLTAEQFREVFQVQLANGMGHIDLYNLFLLRIFDWNNTGYVKKSVVKTILTYKQDEDMLANNDEGIEIARKIYNPGKITHQKALLLATWAVIELKIHFGDQFEEKEVKVQRDEL